MNDFKRALIDVAGDLTESKENVKRALEGKKRRKKGFWLVAPAFVVAFAMLGIALFFIPTKLQQSAASEEAIFNYYLSFEKMAGFYGELDDEQVKKAAFRSYVRAVALQAYGKDYELTYTKEQYEQLEQLQRNYAEHPENPFFDQLFDLQLLTEQQYWNDVLPIFIENQLYANQLEQNALAENTKLSPYFSKTYVDYVVEQYYVEHYAEKLQALEQKYGVTLEAMHYGSSKSGTIAAIEGDMIYFIQNTTYDEVQQMTQQQLDLLDEERLKVWLVNVDDVNVQVGDFVRVGINGVSTSYDEQLANAIAYGLEIIMKKDELTIPNVTLPEPQKETWQHYIEKAQWTAAHAVTNYLTPQYIVQVEEQSYTIFANDYNNLFIVPYGESTIGKLTQGQSEKLEQLLIQFISN